MLRGNIDVQSEVGKGTDITIRVPLSRMPGTDTTVSTPSTDASIDAGPQDDSMRVLQTNHKATNVALYDFYLDEYTSEMTEAGRTLRSYIEDWFGLRACLSLSELESDGLIVVDEKDLAELITHNATHLPTIVICSNSTFSRSASLHNMPPVTEFVSKPFGPHKLAKALRLCLDKTRHYHSGRTPVMSSGVQVSSKSEANDTIPDLEPLTLETDDVLRPLSVQTNGIVTASESVNAQIAIDHWKTGSSIGTNTSGDETIIDDQRFPFPDRQSQLRTNPTSPRSPQDHSRAVIERPKGELTRTDSRRPPLTSRQTEPAAKSAFPHSIDCSIHDSSAVTKHGEIVTFGTEGPSRDTTEDHLPNTTTSSSLTASNMALHNVETPSQAPIAQSHKQEKHPRCLLVDDNKINLRLLETYMRKRKYKLVDSAEDGQLAVQAAESHEHGYDIIFMGQSSLLLSAAASPVYTSTRLHCNTNLAVIDISMPVLNGFEATRAIRDIEEARIHNRKAGNTPSPALIIALTGLASSRDQAEAFTSGVDLFMTKPVSFKEVGRLLDNWEAHGGVKPVAEDEE